jgi:hypothetical protein
MTAAATVSWTCERCEVTASWAAGAEHPRLPRGWIADGDGTFCLGCRRALAGEAALDDAADTTRDERAKARRAAMLEFEVRRDPDRGNGEIARACRSSVPAVINARRRLGIAG